MRAWHLAAVVAVAFLSSVGVATVATHAALDRSVPEFTALAPPCPSVLMRNVYDVGYAQCDADGGACASYPAEQSISFWTCMDGGANFDMFDQDGRHVPKRSMRREVMESE